MYINIFNFIYIMQVIDFSKKYEIPKGCGSHAEIFPKNIFCVIAGSTGCGKTNLMVNLLLQENKINYSDAYIQSHFTSTSIHIPETLLRAYGENHQKQDKTIGENCPFL